LDGPDGEADRSEQDQIHGHHQRNARAGVARIDLVFDPVIRCAATVLVHGFLNSGFCTVEFGALKKHFIDTQNLGAVGVFRSFTFCVMLAMNGHPLLCHHAGGKP